MIGDSYCDGKDNEKLVPKVCLDTYLMSKFRVTVGQFRSFAEDTGYKTKAEKGGGCFPPARMGSGHGMTCPTGGTRVFLRMKITP